MARPSERKLHRALHERVRADHEVDVAGREPRQEIAPLQSGRRAGDELDAEPRFLQQLPQAEEVLLGENFGRRHERHLQAVLHGDEGHEQRHDRFAGADIALQQPVHRRRALHVLDELLQRAPLPFGELERQNTARRIADAVVDLDRAGLRFADGGALSHHQPQLKQEELFEDEPDLRGCSESVQLVCRRVRWLENARRLNAARRSGRLRRRRTSSGKGSGRSSGRRESTSNTSRRCIFGVMAPAFSYTGNDAPGVNRLRVFRLGGIARLRRSLRNRG